MTTKTTKQRFHEFCHKFKHFRIDELDLNDENTVVNIKALVPTCLKLFADAATVYHPEETTSVFIHPDGHIFELVNGEHFCLHRFSRFHPNLSPFLKSKSIIRIFLELFAYAEGCSELWLDAMIRLDNERIELLTNIQECDKNGSWLDPILLHQLAGLEYPHMDIATLDDCLEWINNNCG